MSLNESVNRIVIGSGVIFAGTISGLLLNIFIKGVLTRNLSQTDFGTYSLALTVISLTGAIATLGLHEGVPRYIAYFRGRREDHKIQEIVVSGLLMGLLAGLAGMFISPIAFQHFAAGMFDTHENILSVIRIMIFAIPLTIFMNIAVAIYRGFDRTNVNMYFYDVIRPVSLWICVSLAVFTGVSLHTFVLADLLSMIFTFGLMVVYFIKHPPFKPELKIRFSEPTRQLFKYSFPLLISATLLNLMTWTDTIMLGYFKSSEVVGVYSAVYPLVSFLTIIITSMGFVYIPVASRLWGEGCKDILESLYQIVTKWCFVLSFPIFVLMFVYPEAILTRLYGAEYAMGATVLRILSLGFITNAYFGFNYHTIMAVGDSGFLMKCSTASAVINVVFNFLLIPDYGMLGAAAASAASFASIELLMTARAWRTHQMHPFTMAYRKFTVICLSLLSSMLILKLAFPTVNMIWVYLSFLVLYLVICQYSGIIDADERTIAREVRTNVRRHIGGFVPRSIRNV
ncbi:oligosaccharide flippase family protein [Methanolobus halotolerans]|uniref:Polysaccharide biosynthesis protein n=1 Tax=Methanolobus halotolerans TaxID=2052935 RepID=A0A4E0Q6F3_9EURY|nr:oligosaccharide flippase family protein [Methanolobus halotolerans]TGC09817.1 polysaccharide biosynthesis protein [Methanolobus halotolerans]